MTKKIIFFVLVFFISFSAFAQTIVEGTVKDAKTSEVLPGANIKVSGKTIGTTSDFDGRFVLKATYELPFSIEVSMLGFKTQKIKITSNTKEIEVLLEETSTALDEVVLSASRTPERIMESPVTVERLDLRAIKASSSASFYDGLENLKGVDINSNSLTFRVGV